MSTEEGACPGTFFQPAAAGDEVDVTVAIQCLLFVEDAVGKVTFASASVDEGAVVAFLLVVGALAGMVADAGARPHIVHGPYHGFGLRQGFSRYSSKITFPGLSSGDE